MAGIDPTQAPDERLIDLLIKELGENLSDTEMRSLEGFDAADVGRLRGDLERAAAAVTLAARLPDEPLPDRVHTRLERQAADFFARASASPARPASVPDAHDREAPTIGAPVHGAHAPDGPAHGVLARATAPSRPPPPLGNAAGWWAAAACLLLAVFGWLRSPAPEPTATTAGRIGDAAP
jgi:hypothetical protein